MRRTGCESQAVSNPSYLLDSASRRLPQIVRVGLGCGSTRLILNDIRPNQVKKTRGRLTKNLQKPGCPLLILESDLCYVTDTTSSSIFQHIPYRNSTNPIMKFFTLLAAFTGISWAATCTYM